MDKLSMEVRLLIAFLLMGLVLFVSPYVLGTGPVSDPNAPKAETKAVPQGPVPSTLAPALPAEAPAVAQLPGAVQADTVIEFAVETSVHKVVFSNRGATIRNWILKSYKDSTGQPLDLVNQRAITPTQAGVKPLLAPFSLAFKNQPSTDPNDKLFKVTKGDNGLSVDFEYSDGRVTVKKSFQFAQASYLVKVSSQVIENGVLLPHSLVWRGGFGDTTVTNPTADTGSLYYDTANTKLNKHAVGDAKSGAISSSGNFAFAGLEDKYFAGVALPAEGASTELTTYSDNVPTIEGKEELHVGAAVGGSGANSFEIYAGPKDVAKLRMVDPRLDQIIDWGWFGIIAKPLFYGLLWAAANVTHNYGWAIILVTVVINMVLFPLRLASMKSSKKMQKIQPHVTALNEKYKGLSLNDPKKADQNQELMDLYKKNDINPVGGCVPMLVQIPFFYALYKVLSLAIEMRGAEFLWVTDLSQPEHLALRVLPLLLVVTQFISQKMTPSPGMDPAQQKMMLFMPLLFGYMFYFASAGLVLYWLTSNVVSISQQWLLNRNSPAPASAVVIPAKKKK
ncbi:MAG: membrane protein insertase YidC, partial [Acidobacteriota bacterium]